MDTYKNTNDLDLLGEVKDHEYSMARSELSTALNAIQRLKKRLKGEGQLEAWVQSKITKASDYLRSASDYIESGESDVTEEHMTASDIKKEEELKKKYDPSGMKASMIEKYGKKKGTQIYFATIRKQAMEAYEINEMQNQEVEDDDEEEGPPPQPRVQQNNPQEYLNRLARRKKQQEIARKARAVADAIDSGQLSDSFIYDQLFNESRGTGAARLASFLSRTGRGRLKATSQEIEEYKAAARASQEPIPKPKERQKRIGIGALPSRGVGPEEKRLRGGYGRTPEGIAKRRATELNRRSRDPKRSTADVLRDLERAEKIKAALKNKANWGDDFEYMLGLLLSEDALDEAKLSRAERLQANTEKDKKRTRGGPKYDRSGKKLPKKKKKIFDYDRVVGTTPISRIRIKNKETGEVEGSLSDSEFYNHHSSGLLKPHQKYDFSEFDNPKDVIKGGTNSNVIRRIGEHIRRGYPVRILTARSRRARPGIVQALSNRGIPKGAVTIHTTGDMPGHIPTGTRKATVLQHILKGGEADFYDDAEANARAASEVPGVKSFIVRPTTNKNKVSIRSLATNTTNPNPTKQKKGAQTMSNSSQTLNAEFELWVDSLLYEGYDLSDFTVNELYEAYEVLLDEGRRGDKKPPKDPHNYKGVPPKKEGPRIIPPNYTKQGYGKYTKEEMEVELTPYEYWKSFIFEDDCDNGKIVEDYYDDELEYEEAPMTSYDYWKAYIEEANEASWVAGVGNQLENVNFNANPKVDVKQFTNDKLYNDLKAGMINRGNAEYQRLRTKDPAAAVKVGMNTWRLAKPELAAAADERARTRGTNQTTNPAMSDLKSRLPNPNPTLASTLASTFSNPSSSAVSAYNTPPTTPTPSTPPASPTTAARSVRSIPTNRATGSLKPGSRF